MRNPALRFILLLGLVSLLADVTYEGARGITGPYLGLLGASAAAVGVVAGAGELIGYGLRMATGYLADRTRAYWTITLAGYAVNLAAVPLLALAGRWEVAALLMVVERLGKAVRTPARDAMLACASTATGRGWGFALHEAMDQVGALAGPLVVAAVVASTGRFERAFAVLAIPAALALTALGVARRIYPHPERFDVPAGSVEARDLPRVFRRYLVAAGLLAAGFVDFPLAAYHFKQSALFADSTIPLLYALAMGVDALAALAFGRLFDRVGISALIPAALLGALPAPLMFLGGARWAAAGVALWGAALGAHESILRAAVAGLVSPTRRATAYGVFNAGYGLMWFAGSAAMGLLYVRSVVWLALVAALLELAAIPLLMRLRK